ncbi:hypothetical protein AM587_10003738 [Phytophthora nicotianae]|uniref:PiggyBac transposable element-derived protein domain-containing protein n=1 Tax=Phytophthora nicotianae TaxID=4792 RepID=A0A0W8CLZ6_PHYNI|nr:hypothetical protein AM587_10003738 [Phytophthora nicotianae]
MERRHGVIGRGEFFRWIGIRLAMTLEPRRGPVTVYWNSSVPKGSVGTAANFGQLYGMTCRTFQNIQGWSSVPRPRGSHTVMESSCANGSKMYALCWNDRKPKTIISNRGTTLPGSDSVRVRHRRVDTGGEICTERYEKRIPRPYMVELFFRYFSTIDVHDHCQQGSLEMERQWLTHSWAHRIFATTLGMVIVYSYLAYQHETKSNNIVACSTVAFGEFASRLAHQLIFNDYLTGRVRRDGNADGDMDDVSVPVHSLLALGDRPRYKRLKKTPQRAQRRCKICKKKASFYCATCSDCNEDSYFALCGTMTGRTCYHQHLEASQAR